MSDYRAILEDGLWTVVNISSDGVLLVASNPWRVIVANQAAANWLETSTSELAGRAIEALFEASSVDVALKHVESATQSGDVIAAPIEFKVGGAVEARFCRVVFHGESLVGLIFNTGSPRLDPVTGLPDRNFLMARLTALLRQGNDANSPFAVLFIDVNNFKDVNDRHGHLIGDSVLREAARRIGPSLAKGDHVVRFGGDEFVVLIERVAIAAELKAVIARIEEAVSKPIATPNGEVTLSLSVGVAMGPGEFRTPDEILAAADRAMYAAKRMAN